MTRSSRVAAVVLLVVAGLCTALMVPIVAELRPLSGPDTMGLFSVIVVIAVRWLALAATLALAALGGRLEWVAMARGKQAAAALGVHALAGGASFASLVLATGPDSAAITAWCWVLAVVVPAFTMAVGAVACLASDRTRIPGRVLRGGAIAALVVVAAGGFVMWKTDRARTDETLALQAAAAAERERETATRLAAIGAMRPDAPLEEWLRWLDSTDERVLDRAVAAIRARPTLQADLSALLQGPGAIHGLRYIWLWMPDPPTSLAQPSRVALASLPAWAEHQLRTADAPAPGTPDPSSVCESAVAVATIFERKGIDIGAPLRKLYETLVARQSSGVGESDPGYGCREFLKTWVDAH